MVDMISFDFDVGAGRGLVNINFDVATVRCFWKYNAAFVFIPVVGMFN